MAEKYYVKYPCGGESRLLDKAEAKELAEIFNGELRCAKPIYKRFALFGQFRKLVGWER